MQLPTYYQGDVVDFLDLVLSDDTKDDHHRKPLITDH